MAANWVWYPAADDGVKNNWLLCQLLARTAAGGATLKPLKSDQISISPEDAKLICPRHSDQGDEAQNLVSISRDGLGPDEVEDVIRNHFCNQLPYTNINDVTLCVNPHRELSIYGEQWVDKYSELDPTLPPHIYNAAAKAYSRIMNEKQSQLLFLTGENCSGKSRAFEHILEFLGQTAGDGDEELKQILKALHPLISVKRSCGKAAWMSTRAMMELDLGLGQDGFVCRTAASVRLLETRHLLRQEGNQGEEKQCNFDALYLAAKDETSKEWLGEAMEFRLLGDEVEFEEYDDEGTAGKAWLQAMAAMEVDSYQVLRVLCGLILLGELRFAGPAPPRCEPDGAAEAAAKALGLASGQLIGALTADARSAEDATERLENVMQEMYRRLVAWVVKAINDKNMGDSEAMGHSIIVAEVPSIPGEAAELPLGFDRLALQVLHEAMFANLLNMHGAELHDFSEKKSLADSVLEAITGSKGLKSVLQATAAGLPQAAGKLKEWVSAQASSGSNTISLLADDELEVSGGSSLLRHRLDSQFVAGAAGTQASPALLKTISQSTCKCLADLAGDAFQAPVTGMAAVEQAVTRVTEPLCRASSGMHAWLVCCLRPNDKGVPDQISRPLLLQQVQKLRLADVLHLSAEPSYSTIWPLKGFRRLFASIVPTLTDSETDQEACMLLVKSAGADEGTVGSENVFGGETLKKLLEKKQKEIAMGKEHSLQAKQDLEKIMDEKVGRLHNEQLLQGQQHLNLLEEARQRSEESRQQAESELAAIRGKQDAQSIEQQEMLRKLLEQQSDLQKRQDEQIQALVQQQQQEMERLKQRARAVSEVTEDVQLAAKVTVDDGQAQTKLEVEIQGLKDQLRARKEQLRVEGLNKKGVSADEDITHMAGRLTELKTQAESILMQNIQATSRQLALTKEKLSSQASSQGSFGSDPGLHTECVLLEAKLAELNAESAQGELEAAIESEDEHLAELKEDLKSEGFSGNDLEAHREVTANFKRLTDLKAEAKDELRERIRAVDTQLHATREKLTSHAWSEPVHYAKNYTGAIRFGLGRPPLAEDKLRTESGEVITFAELRSLPVPKLQAAFPLQVQCFRDQDPEDQTAVQALSNKLAELKAQLEKYTQLKEEGLSQANRLVRNRALHDALTQMAALLRVAKDREQARSAGLGVRDGDLKALENECEFWRRESAALRAQVSSFKKNTREGHDPA